MHCCKHSSFPETELIQDGACDLLFNPSPENGPLGLKKTLASDEDIARFMSYVDKLPNGCWYWTGARSRGKGNKKWYGSFHFKGKTIRAHAFSNDHIAGRCVPPGHHRDHTCHFSMCVNFDHIEVVTKEINQERKMKRNDHSHSL